VTLFAYPLQWPLLVKHDVFERVVRPWVGKKVKEYMGVEEPAVVQHIMKIVGGRPTPEVMADKVKEIMDEKTKEFVEKMWQTMVFEEMKIQEGLYQK